MRSKAAEVDVPEGDVPHGSMKIPTTKVAGLIIDIEGITPLIVHKFGEKARNQIRETQAKTATKGAKSVRGAEEIAGEIAACHYGVADAQGLGATEGRFGFPASGFKASAVSAAPFGSGIFKSRAKSMFFVVGEIVPLLCDTIEPREDAVRLENGVVQLRYRPYYLGWRASFGVSYMPDTISSEQLVNLFDLAGTLVGIGENRPGKTGATYGQWRVTRVATSPVADLPRYMMEVEDNDMLARARAIARLMGAVS